MSLCVFQAKENVGMPRRCTCSCTLYIGNKSCVARFITDEISELYQILMQNEKKVDVLVQMNNCIAEALNTNSTV